VRAHAYRVDRGNHGSRDGWGRFCRRAILSRCAPSLRTACEVACDRGAPPRRASLCLAVLGGPCRNACPAGRPGFRLKRRGSAAVSSLPCPRRQYYPHFCGASGSSGRSTIYFGQALPGLAQRSHRGGYDFTIYAQPTPTAKNPRPLTVGNKNTISFPILIGNRLVLTGVDIIKLYGRPGRLFT